MPVETGFDTFVVQAFPNRVKGKSPLSVLRIGTGLRALVDMSMIEARGRIVTAARLSNRFLAATPAQTLTAAHLSEKFSPATAKWSEQPDVRAGARTAALGALTAGQRFYIDVTPHAQAYAAGTVKHFGWRITTSLAGPLRLPGFQAEDAWLLELEYADEPAEPTGLFPDGGSIGLAKPVIGFDPVVFGDDSAVSAVRAIANGWNSGVVASTAPQLDTGATAFPGFPSGTAAPWTMQWLDAVTGVWSSMSDPAEVTYRPKPANVGLTSPAAGVVTTREPTLGGTLPSGVALFARAEIIEQTSGKVRWASLRLPQSGTAAWAIPVPYLLRGRHAGSSGVVLQDDTVYDLRVQIWDRDDRVPSPGDPPYLEHLGTIAYSPAGPAPTSLTVTPVATGEPRCVWEWEVASLGADTFELAVDGEVVEVLDADSVPRSGLTYTWVDEGHVPPGEQRTVAVAQTIGSDTTPRRSAVAARDIEGAWLVWRDHQVRLDDFDPSQLTQGERYSTYWPLGASAPVEIHYADEGVGGPVAGVVSKNRRADLAADLAALEAMQDAGWDDVFHLVFRTVSLRIHARSLSCLPTSSNDQWTAFRTHDVKLVASPVAD